MRKLNFDRPVKRDWLKESHAQIERRLEDARAHAERGDLPTAHKRLDELADNLADLHGTARASAYWDAFDEVQRNFDPDLHRTDILPNRHGEKAARTVPVLGRDHAADLAAMVAAAHRHLDTSANASLGDLAAWQIQHTNALKQFSRLTLSAASTGVREAVKHLMIKPELRD